MTKTWTNCHQHTIYSFLDGHADVNKLAERAKELGMRALAQTDHGHMHGALDFYEATTNMGIQPIIGMEAYQSRKTRFDLDEEERAGKALTEFEQRGPHHLTVLARNEAGYKNLIKLSSRAYLEGFYVKPRIDHELLSKHASGLVVLSGCLAGEVCQALLRHDYEYALNTAAWFQDTLGKEHYFIEVMDHGVPEQAQVMDDLVKIAKTIGAPIVPTADCHYVHKQDAAAHDLMLCVSTGARVDDEKRFRFYNDEFYLKSYDEMAERFPDEWLQNTMLIADQVDLQLKFGELYFPAYPKVPDSETTQSYLEKLVWTGINERYPNLTNEVRDRTEYELEVVHEMGFDSYFLVVWDLVKWAKDNGIRVGWGRGSAAGSILSYALRITELDPLRFGLLFERFLVPGRKSMPDIDLDFDDRYRELVIDYARQTYGDDHVAHICTFATVGAKLAIRDAARGLGVDYNVGDRLSKLVPPPVLGITKTLKDCLETDDFKKAYKDSTNKTVLDAAFGLEGKLRQPGQHAAGVVISQQPVTDYVPVWRRPMKGTKKMGPITTQYDMHKIEENGLLKIDFLGLRNLGVIDICIIDMIQGELIDDKALPLDDDVVYDMLCSGNTIGVFQLESSGMQQMTMAMQPRSIEDIMALISLYRPGPMGSGMDRLYISRKNGKTEAAYAHPKLENVLASSHGIMLYQEDVLNVSRVLAGFDEGEADDLRKAIGKKQMDKIGFFREKFVAGCKKTSQVDPHVANKIYSDIEYFGGYGFNRAHAASYGMVSYVTAYFKAHYPAEYMAALLSSVQNKPERQALYLNECRTMGITVRPPSVNRSVSNFTVTGDKEVLFGLQSINGMGDAAVGALLSGRDTQPYGSIYDFFRRCNPEVLNKGVMEKLIESGAFDELLEVQGERHIDRGVRDEILAAERNRLGFYIIEHPLQGAWNVLEKLASHEISKLDIAGDNETVTIAGLVSAAEKVTTKKGDTMYRFVLEDMAASVGVLVFPRDAKRLDRIPADGDVVVVTGRVQHEGDEEHFLTKVFLTELQHPELPEYSGEEPIVLTFPGAPNYSIMGRIEQIIDDTPGFHPVYVECREGPHKLTLAFKKPTSLSIKTELENLVALDQGIANAYEPG